MRKRWKGYKEKIDQLFCGWRGNPNSRWKRMMIGYIGIALAMFALGVLTLKMIYGTMYTQKDDELLTQAITIADSVHYQDTSDLSEILNRFWQQTDMAEIAGGMIIFDSEGNVRGQSGNFVCITAYEDTKNDILGIARKDGEGSYVINLDEYLTEKDKGNIRLLEKEVTEKKGSLSIDEIAVTKDGDGYRPTRVVFKNRYGKEMLTVTFAKDVSDEIVLKDAADPYGYSIQFWNHTLYDDARSLLNEDFNDFLSLHEEEIWEDISQMIADDFDESSWTLWQTINDRQYHYGSIEGTDTDGGHYYYCMVFEYDVNSKVLESHAYRNSRISVILLYVCFGVFLFGVLTYIQIKGYRLEEARYTFTNAVAHELKTPLAIIQNQSECVLEEIAPEKNESYIRSIHEEAVRMNEMVVSMLQYTKLDEYHLKMEKCRLDLLVKEEWERYAALAEDKNVNITCSMDQECNVHCDEELIRLVIDNYLSNAVKFASDGGHIEIDIHRTRSKWNVSVWNEGSHLETEDIPNVFHTFYKGDKSRHREGTSTGLGLAISAKILDRHKAKYGCKNEERKGADEIARSGVLFYFIL